MPCQDAVGSIEGLIDAIFTVVGIVVTSTFESKAYSVAMET